jgi:hypothetical protein
VGLEQRTKMADRIVGDVDHQWVGN